MSRVWTKQPPAGTQIDWSNPITKGIIIAVPFNERGLSGSVARDYSGKNNHGVISSTGNTSIVSQTDLPLGSIHAIRYAGSQGYSVSFGVKGYNRSEGTRVWWFLRTWPNNFNSQTSIVYPNVSGGAIQNRMYWFGPDTWWFFDFSPGGPAHIIAGDDIPQNRWVQCAMTWSVSQNFAGAYVNGVLKASGTYSNPSTDITELFYVRENQDLEARDYGPLYHWDRSLVEAEIASLYQNGWQIFKLKFRFVVAASQPPVFVTDVNTTESWDDGDTGLPITGTGFI